MLETAYEQVQIYLIYLLIISIPLAFVCRMQTKSIASRVIAMLIVFTMSLSLAWLLILLCSFMYVLNGLFVITLTISSSLLLYSAYQLFIEDGPHRVIKYMFIGYSAAVLVVTLISRMGTSNNRVFVDIFNSLYVAVSLSDPEMTEHFLLNILMFVPFGALYVMMTPSARQVEAEQSETPSAPAGYGYGYGQEMMDEPDDTQRVAERHWTAAFFFGVAYSSIIESLQLVFSMGECDMLDVVANSFGALAGSLLGLAGRRFVKYK